MAEMDVQSARLLKGMLAVEVIPDKVLAEYDRVMDALVRVGYAGRRLDAETLALICLKAGALSKPLPPLGKPKPKSEPAAPTMSRGGIPHPTAASR